MANTYGSLTSLFTAIANALRSLKGTSAQIVADDFPSEISGITTKAAETYTPTTSDQTIAAGQYLSGAQTVEGDANLVAGNIKNGVSIFGVAGTLVSRLPVISGGFLNNRTNLILTAPSGVDLTQYNRILAVRRNLIPDLSNGVLYVYFEPPYRAMYINENNELDAEFCTISYEESKITVTPQTSNFHGAYYYVIWKEEGA